MNQLETHPIPSAEPQLRQWGCGQGVAAAWPPLVALLHSNPSLRGFCRAFGEEKYTITSVSCCTGEKPISSLSSAFAGLCFSTEFMNAIIKCTFEAAFLAARSESKGSFRKEGSPNKIRRQYSKLFLICICLLFPEHPGLMPLVFLLSHFIFPKPNFTAPLLHHFPTWKSFAACSFTWSWIDEILSWSQSLLPLVHRAYLIHEQCYAQYVHYICCICVRCQATFLTSTVFGHRLNSLNTYGNPWHWSCHLPANTNCFLQY